MLNKNNKNTYPDNVEAKPKFQSIGVGTPQFCLSHPPILPSLPRIQESFMQNRPNSQNGQITATSFLPKTYPNIPARRTKKNKPNQTQSQHAESPPTFRLAGEKNRFFSV